ncbi:MAG TPA: GNAT family N-acetyltransferase [Frankiaceae bacterium]|nr:GNAT family N-acetyltransferase [Frankiaceae bacterium]
MIENVADGRRDDSGGVDWLLVDRLKAPPGEVARVLLEEARGVRVVTEDDALVEALVAGGGRVQRRGHDYEYAVADAPAEWARTPAPQGFRLSNDLDPHGLAASHERANPPGHPDHEGGLDHVEDLRSMIAGEVLGPYVPEASWQVEDAEGPCGAVIVVDRPGAARRGWVVEVFVDPRHQGRGLGRVLLQRAVAGTRAAGLPVLGLVVSDGNPARHAYDALGFRLVRSGTNVDIPLLS